MRAIFALAALSLSCAPAIRYSDPGPYPFESNDHTAILVGCGNELATGHLYCRFPAGSKPSGYVTVVVPPTDCKATSCASIVVFGPDASKIVDQAIPKGQAYLSVPWSALVGAEPFQERQRGFYPVLVRWSWTEASTGETFQAIAEGEIRLRVHRADYAPLDFDPASQTWTWSVGGRTFGATDKGRTAVAPK